jgi:hypothetical protein
VDAARPFEIADNSFIVEEAFNQEPGVFQHIFNVTANRDGNWQASFTQEWPLFSQTHQFSYTLQYLSLEGRNGVGDLMLNYRWQVLTESDSGPAFSPRVSLIVPSGNATDGLGNGGPGWQVNLPFSKQVRDVYLHWNAGFTNLPVAEQEGANYNLFIPHVAVSGIWRVRPMFHLMLENFLAWEESVENAVRRRHALLLVSPGFRWGFNSGQKQTVLGFAAPVSFSDEETQFSALGYFSYELPFLKQR